MKRMLSVVLAAVVSVGAFTGCTPKISSSALNNGSSKPGQKVTLNTVSEFGGTDPNGSVYQNNIVKFMDSNPNVTVKDASATSDEAWKAQVINDFESGSEADVTFFFTSADAAKIISSGQVVDLATIRAEYPDYAKNISADAISQMKEADGKTYSVPLTGYWEGLFCNKDLFTKFHAPLPKTWDDFMSDIKIFKQNKIIPLASALGDIPHYTNEHLILAAGGVHDHHVNPGTDMSKVPASWLTGLGLYKTLYDAGAFAANMESIKDTEAIADFVQKKAAMRLDGSWLVGQITDQKNTTVMPMPAYNGSPKDPSDIIAGFSSGFYISKKAWDDPAKRDAAVKFVEYMTTNQSIAQFIAVAGGSPAASVPAPATITPLVKDGMAMVSAAKNIDTPIDSRVTPACWATLNSNIPSIATGKISPQDALKAALAKNQ